MNETMTNNSNLIYYAIGLVILLGLAYYAYQQTTKPADVVEGKDAEKVQVKEEAKS